jgi:hypothetical protein
LTDFTGRLSFPFFLPLLLQEQRFGRITAAYHQRNPSFAGT